MEITYTPPGGDTVDLLTGRDAFIEMDTLEGWVAHIEYPTVEAPGVAGAIAHPEDWTVAPLEMRFTLVAKTTKAWSVARSWFSSRNKGTLAVTNPNRKVSTSVRLAAAIPSLGLSPRPGSRIPVTLVADSGLWWEERNSTPTRRVVDVANDGEVPIAPTIVWSGNGGDVTLPSGATFTLPPTTDTAYLSLASENSGVVKDAAGIENEHLTAAAQAVAERVQPATTGKFTIPESVYLVWNIGRCDPWI